MSFKQQIAKTDLSCGSSSEDDGAIQDADWIEKIKTRLLHMEHADKIMSFMWNMSNHGSFRLVGGCVRDMLLGMAPKDIDLSTDLKPEQVMRLAKQYGVQAIPTGLQHGTVTIVLSKSFHVEITTLRHDVECYGRQATVEFTNSFREDAARRDFTINAMSYCPLKSRLYDYFGGISHLKEHKLVFIGDAHERICEDYLRILRFFRFSSYYANDLDMKGYESCLNNLAGLNHLSQERITSEMNKIFSCYEKMEYILPKMQPIFEQIKMKVDLTHISSTCNDEANMINIMRELNKLGVDEKQLYLVSYSTCVSHETLSKMKLSKADICSINLNRDVWMFYNQIFKDDSGKYDNTDEWRLDFKLYLVKLIMTQSHNDNALELALKLGQTLKIVPCATQFDTLKSEAAKFPVNGNEIIALGYEGKDIGRIMNSMREKWIMSDFQASKAELLETALRL